MNHCKEQHGRMAARKISNESDPRISRSPVGRKGHSSRKGEHRHRGSRRNGVNVRWAMLLAAPAMFVVVIVLSLRTIEEHAHTLRESPATPPSDAATQPSVEHSLRRSAPAEEKGRKVGYNRPPPVGVPVVALTAEQQRFETEHGCTPVYFWGGGKAGSTTLAALLKHDARGQEWDPDGQFIDLGKEVCWAEGDSNTGFNVWLARIRGKCSQSLPAAPHSPTQIFALDGCPRYQLPKHAVAILNRYADAKFIMLVRDPLDRLVSHFNDNIRRGRQTYQLQDMLAKLLFAIQHHKPDERVVIRKEVAMSMYGMNMKILLDLLTEKRRKQLLVVPMDALQRDPQRVVDDVMDFIGGRRKVVHEIHANAASSERGYTKLVDDELRNEWHQFFKRDVQLLERLMNRRFSWSSSYYNTTIPDDMDTNTSWITAHPHSLSYS